MLKVECESCKAPYQVDERRVPPTGLKMRCPKCGHTFLVSDPSKGAADAAPGALPRPPPPKKATMVGLAPKPAPAKPAAAPPAAAAQKPQIPAVDSDAALPALKPAAPKLAPAARQAAPAAPPPMMGFGGIDDIDLPSVPDEVGLPATVAAKPRPGAPKPVLSSKPVPAPQMTSAPPIPSSFFPNPPTNPPGMASPFNFEVDLPSLPNMPPPPTAKPSAAPKAPSTQTSPFGTLDLPAPRAAAPPMNRELDFGPSGGPFGDVDLPAVARHGFADLPSPARGAGLPASRITQQGVMSPNAGGFPSGGFGEIDLPSMTADLPMVGVGVGLPSPSTGGIGLPMAAGGVGLPMMSGGVGLPMASGGVGLPMPSGGVGLPTPSGGVGLPSAAGGSFLPQMSGGVGLPSAMGPGAHLPSAMGPGAHLPSAMGPGAHLPSAMGLGAHLPSPYDQGGHLPSPMGMGAHLPSTMGHEAHMPLTVSDDRLLPNRGPSPIAFGELDLPLVGGGDILPQTRSGGGFGEVDLPSDHGGSLPPQTGGMAFGEVDLGGGSDDGSQPLGPPPAATGGGFDFQEASLAPANGAERVVPGRLRSSTYDGPPSKLPKILGISLAVLVLGGAALQLTSFGAFGHLYISDKLHAGENAANAASRGDLARKKDGIDTFLTMQAAADDLLEAKKHAPRNRPLGAYAAFVEYMTQVRFGLDPARAARVSTYLIEIPVDVKVPYAPSAKAAQLAQSGDWAGAKAATDDAIATEPKDGIQYELQILKGEIALAQRDFAVALTAFNAAHATGATARTFFGIARAQAMSKTLPKAREAVDETLKISPMHAGALTLRAQLLWDMQRDDLAAMKDLGTVLDEKNRKTLGAFELAAALTTKGWIMFARDRAGDARAAFDEAVKVDPRNVGALIGQGELLYADGRYTEALTRFDDASVKDPSSTPAIVGSAKAKVSLERLSDAKTQLAAARVKSPKDMMIALWLARVEEALGNKKGAEQLYGVAIDLANPQSPDAIQAYSQYARFLAGQGKNADAAAKLEQARAKLPDTAALQRAFGEVAAEQGQFQDALEHFQLALQRNPADLGTRFRLGVTYRKMHKLDLAAKALDEVGAVDKEYPNLGLERGLLFEESGDVQKALEQFTSALQKTPNDIDLMLRVGASYVTVGDTEKALPLLLRVKDQRPNSAEANHFVGRAYLKQGGLEAAAAMRYLQRAVALDPNKADYHLYVAWAANEAAPPQLGLARDEVDKALQLDKLSGDAYWQRGIVERREGRPNDAVKNLLKALELKPTRFEAHASLAEAYEDKNDLGAATVEWQRAIAGDDKPAYWRFKYGKLLADKNQNAEAAKHVSYALEKAKEMTPKPAWISTAAFVAGETLRKLGQKASACEDLKFFMDVAPPTSADRRDAMKQMSELGCPYDQ